jgi:hypothetical protein
MLEKIKSNFNSKFHQELEIIGLNSKDRQLHQVQKSVTHFLVPFIQAMDYLSILATLSVNHNKTVGNMSYLPWQQTVDVLVDHLTQNCLNLHH